MDFQLLLKRIFDARLVTGLGGYAVAGILIVLARPVYEFLLVVNIVYLLSYLYIYHYRPYRRKRNTRQ